MPTVSNRRQCRSGFWRQDHHVPRLDHFAKASIRRREPPTRARDSLEIAILAAQFIVQLRAFDSSKAGSFSVCRITCTLQRAMGKTLKAV